MTPKGILQVAKNKEIEIIGICDHNSSENSLAVMNAAKKMNINVLPGMEVTSHGENDEKAFGMQVVVNEKEEVLGFNNKLLIGATTIPLEEVVRLIHSFSGIAIASHIDRESFSIIGQLGFVPHNLELDALEISPNITFKEARKRYADNYPITCSSDAHYPDDIGKAFTSFLLEDITVSDIKKALNNEEGRKLIH
jgi:predicted metal-dependent phosphoesterase TrpH